MPPAINLDLNIEIDVLTAGSVAEVVIEVLELLLYQRNQIPFVYKTYKYYVDKWKEETPTIDEERRSSKDEVMTTMHNLNMEAQRERATQTKQSISAMRELIAQTFERNEIKCLRFLFGSTIFTPIEAYTIDISTAVISRTHLHVHHPIPSSRLNQTLINLLTSEDLYAIFSKNLSPTNVFMEIEMLDDSLLVDTATKSRVIPKDFCELPVSCKNIQLHLVHTKPILSSDAVALQCCKELEVFKDMINLNISHKTEDTVKKDETIIIKSAHDAAWWEAEIFVRGFKEKPMKAGSFWTK